jgi:putative redox protein
MSSQRVEFAGSSQQPLAGVLEMPEHGVARAHAVFAHCFACGKNSLAAVRISRALAAQGIATLRFDFTGLGGSEGDFGHGGFASNVADLVAAAHWLAATHDAPGLLVGHSLGGTAALLAAQALPGVKAVCTIGAPASAGHILKHLVVEPAQTQGDLTVTLAGRSFAAKASFIDSFKHEGDTAQSHGGQQALLVMHSPHDQVVEIDEAQRLFKAARHPRSFVSLDGADHLLTRAEDAGYAADIIAAWARRYLPLADEGSDGAPVDLRGGEVWVGEHDHAFWRAMHAGDHHIDADEPPAVGGGGRGPTPYDLLLMALGACTSMTLRQYAKRKGYALKDVQVRLRHEQLHAQDCAECEGRDGKVERIARAISVRGPLSEDQRADLLRIADRCPVHRTLEGTPVIATTLVRDR